MIPAAAVTDTIKRAGNDREIVATEDRDELWTAQTPQIFRAEALRAAHAGDPAAADVATDDAMLVEASGAKVLIEPVAAENFKVTTGADLERAALLLARGESRVALALSGRITPIERQLAAYSGSGCLPAESRRRPERQPRGRP